MISKLRGELESVENSRALLRSGDLSYEVLLPAADEMRLADAIGETVEFHTLHYLEAQGQGASFLPRLIGFSTPQDRAFFELFTTVKGMGNRKALRALQMDFNAVADAIANRNAELLQSLPEIGKRTAETIIVDLNGKVDEFVIAASAASAADSPEAAMANDAIKVLTQLGETTILARRLVERAMAADATINSPNELVAAAYRLKEE